MSSTFNTTKVWLRCGAHPFSHRPAGRLFLVDVPELAFLADHLLARLLLAALLVPLDEHVLLEQVDVVEGLEQVGRLAQQRLVRVRDRVRGGVRGRVRVKVRVGVKVRVRVRASSEEFGLG